MNFESSFNQAMQSFHSLTEKYMLALRDGFKSTVHQIPKSYSLYIHLSTLVVHLVIVNGQEFTYLHIETKNKLIF